MTQDIKLLNFKYNKVFVERNDDFKGELKITPNINIKNIEKHKIESSKQETLKIEFGFNVDYDLMGKIELEGKMHLLAEPSIIKEAIDGWKDKKLSDSINLLILNVIMQKASVKALGLEEEMNFPPHVQLPRLQLSKKE